MLPPQHHDSLPSAKYLSFQGLWRPFWRRRLASGLSASEVMYSTHSIISCTVPEPTLPHTYGWQPTCSQKSMNSCVPNELSSTTPPQCVLIILGRLLVGPMPFRQWYSSAKQPPGQ